MLDARFAYLAGWLVDGVARMSFDGHPVVILLCSADSASRADGNGYAEIIVCGADVRLLGVPLDTAQTVIAEACVYPAAEIQQWVNRLESDRRDRRRAAARSRFATTA